MYIKDKLIRFQHCDPAGIVFYPQYFVLIHELVEDWFNEGLGQPFVELVKRRGMGVPLVKVECEFIGPNSLGDTLSFALAVKRIGGSSIVLSVKGTTAGKDTLRATLTVVYTSLKELRAVPVPDELRAAMARFMEP